MQLAHPVDDDLPGLDVGVDVEGRIFGPQLLQTDAKLLLIRLGLRLNRQRDDRLREVHRLEHDRLLLVAQRVARRDALEAHGRRDVAGVHLFDFLTLVRVHLQEAPDALRALLRRVEHR